MPKLHKVTQPNITTAKGLAALPASEVVAYRKVAKGLSVGVYKPGTGTISWRVRVRHDGKYRVETLAGVSSYQEAVQAALAFVERLRAGEAPTRQEKAVAARGRLTVRELLEEYLGQESMVHAKGDRYAAWRRDAERLAGRYVLPYLGDRRISTLTADDLRQLQTTLRREVSAETVNRGTVSLRAALNYAQVRGYIPAAFWKAVPLLEEAELHDKVAAKAYYDLEVREAFLEAAGEPLAAIVRCMFYTGCRPSEARRLTVGDVHVDKRLKQPYLLLRTYKGPRATGTSRRFPLSGERLAFFTVQAEGRPKAEPLFRSARGLEWKMATLAKAHNKVRDALGLDGDFQTYCWRHAWITDMVRADVQPLTVAKLAGTSLQFIQENYTAGDLTLVDQLPEP